MVEPKTGEEGAGFLWLHLVGGASGRMSSNVVDIIKQGQKSVFCVLGGGGGGA